MRTSTYSLAAISVATLPVPDVSKEAVTILRPVMHQEVGQLDTATLEPMNSSRCNKKPTPVRTSRMDRKWVVKVSVSPEVEMGEKGDLRSVRQRCFSNRESVEKAFDRVWHAL